MEPEYTPQRKIHSYHCDHRSLPLALVNAEGKADWSAEYDAWGNVLSENNPHNLKQLGQQYDEDTELYYNWYRYYDPLLGRYITQDSIGLNGGINLYQYAPNPLSWIDPPGLNKNSNDAVGDWVLYDVIDPETGYAKVGIGKAEDVMPARNNANRRAEASVRKVRKDPNFKNAQATVVKVLRER